MNNGAPLEKTAWSWRAQHRAGVGK